MNTMRLVFSLLVVSFTVSSVQALEWVEYEGTIPENAVSVNEGTEDRPVCRRNSRIGIVNDAGKCYSVKVGGGVSKKTEDDGYQILVDNSEATATEGMYTYEQVEEIILDFKRVLDVIGDTRYKDNGTYNSEGIGTYSHMRHSVWIGDVSDGGSWLEFMRASGETVYQNYRCDECGTSGY